MRAAYSVGLTNPAATLFLAFGQRNQPRPQRSHRAGPADDHRLPIDSNRISGRWIGVARHVRHSASAAGTDGAGTLELLCMSGAQTRTHAAAGCAFVCRSFIPHHFARNRRTGAGQLVPPQPRTCGLDAGKSTCLPPALPVSRAVVACRHRDRDSSAAAAWQASSSDVIACAVQVDSGPPQLIEITLACWSYREPRSQSRR